MMTHIVIDAPQTDYTYSKEVNRVVGNEFGYSNGDKTYDDLMMDQNLTPNDKIQFLAANDPDFVTHSIVNDKNINNKVRLVNMRNKIRRKRGFYDDMSYFDDENLLDGNLNKYNGDWYRYVIENFPQLSSSLDKQQKQQTQVRRQQEEDKNIIKDVENINNEKKYNKNKNDKSVSSGKQKLLKDEGRQRSHSTDKLWYVFLL